MTIEKWEYENLTTSILYSHQAYVSYNCDHEHIL